MQTQQTFLSKYKSLIILALDFVFMLVLIKILPFSSQENRGLALLIFIGILWLTEAFNITVTSLMVPVVAIGLGLINTQKALAPFSTPIIYMFFGGFVVAAVLQIQNLDKIIANYIIRLAKGNLKLSITYLFTVTTFLSMWINNTAVAAMMLPLTMGMLKGINAEKNHRLYAFVLLGMAFSASLYWWHWYLGRKCAECDFGISNSSDFHGMARLRFPGNDLTCAFNDFFFMGDFASRLFCGF